MINLKNVVAAATLCLGFATPALAEPLSHLLFMHPFGTVDSQDIVDQAHINMLLREAKPLPAGTLIFLHGDKLYIAQDKKMSDGRMLSEDVMH